MEEFNLQSIDQTFTRFKVGAKVMARFVCGLKEGYLLNIGGKKDGLIPYSDEEEEALKDIKKGDCFETIIVSTKDESGMIVLSKKKADDLRLGNAVVSSLQVGDSADFIITSATRSGLVSNLGAFEVFIPYSQISLRRVDNNLENYVNKQFKAIVLELDVINKKIIASIKAYEENEKHTKETAFWEAMYEGKIVNGKVVRFTDFGAFVNVGDTIDCLVHNSEVSYDRNVKASEVLTLDESYDFKVIAFDKENKRVSLSLKALQQNPLVDKLKAYNVGDVVKGTVKKILPFGAVIVFGDNIEGMLHVKETSYFYVKNVHEVAKVGQELELKIIAIDLDACKVSLSLKALQEEPEVIKMAKEREQKAKEEVYAETVYSTDNPAPDEQTSSDETEN